MISTSTLRGGLCASCGEMKAELCETCRNCRECSCCLALQQQIREMASDAWSETPEEEE